MSRTTKLMVYTAVTEDQSQRQFERGAAELWRDGYVPVSQSWDNTTLTVVFERIAGAAPSPAEASSSARMPAGLGSRIRRRLGLAAAS